MRQVSERKGTAVVIGASVSGALAAKVLRSHFDRVLLVDRDDLPEGATTRAKVPQEHHVHLLLQRGRENMERLYPGFLAELEAAGAEVVDLSHGVKWHLAGRWKCRWPTGITAHYCSRTLVEHHLRRRAASLEGVDVLPRTTVRDLLWDDAGRRVTGVRIAAAGGVERNIDADFVLDASGRWSRTPAWLKERSFDTPPEEHVNSRLGYASRIYRRDPRQADRWDVLLVTPRLPYQRRMGVISPIEGNRWMVTLGGWLGDFPKATEESFEAFMRELPVPDIHDVIRGATPLSEVRRFALSGGLRRRYDRLRYFPQGFFVLGDAVCSLNPIYSQGMSVSSMQVMAFADALAVYLDGTITATELFRETVLATETSWCQARSGDERFAEIRGVERRGHRWKDAYFDELVRLSTDNREVTVELLKTNNLLRNQPSLLRPTMLCRVLGSAVRRHIGASVA